MLHPYLRRWGCWKRSRFSVTRVLSERGIVIKHGIDENEKPREKKPFTFIIIGGGLTGTSMLCQFVAGFQAALLQGRKRLSPIEISIIEKSQVFGPGFPHSDQNAMPFHLINMCARDMSILSGQTNDFQSWVDQHSSGMEKKFQMVQDSSRIRENPDPDCHHYPRPVMGEYLKARFREAVSEAESIGIRVRLYPGHEAINLSETMTNRVRVVLTNLKSGKEFFLFANRVLLATGHWFTEGNQPGYFPSPWPAAYLQEHIPKGASVAIIGSSLSAIDAVLTLTADGTFSRAPTGKLVYRPTDQPRKLTLYSRRALLPTVRGRSGPYRNQFMTHENIQALIQQKGKLVLEDLFELLDRDLKQAYGRPFPWKDLTDPKLTPKERLHEHILEARYGDGPHGDIIRQTILQQIFPMVRQSYLALTPTERMRLNRNFSTLFFSYAAPMPMINAEKLLALMQSGIVVMRRLVESPPFKVKGDSFSFTFQGPDGEKREAKHSCVVDARGQGRFYHLNPQILAANLLESGTVEIEPLDLKVREGKDTPQKEHRAEAPSFGGGTGSVWIDPHTHRIQRTGPDGGLIVSEKIYAVGAMTRGQIIDASMAHGSAVSTNTIAQEWITQIFSETM